MIMGIKSTEFLLIAGFQSTICFQFPSGVLFYCERFHCIKLYLGGGVHMTSDVLAMIALSPLCIVFITDKKPSVSIA